MIPLDLEDVLGVSAAAAVKRCVLFVSSIFLASALAMFAGGSAEAILDLDLSEIGDWMEPWFIAWLLPFITPWVVFYFPVFMVMAWWSFTADEFRLERHLNGLAAASALILAAAPDWDWTRGLAFILLGGMLMTVRHLGLVLGNRRRTGFESRMMGLAVENERRREEIRRRTGTEVAGRDYLSLDEPPR